MKKREVIFIFLIVYLFGIINFYSANLGTFKFNETVNIRVLSNCSSVNLTEVTSGNVTYRINSAMTNLGGQTFNYSFSNTSYSGEYTYSWNPSCSVCGVDTECGNNFFINPTGIASTQERNNSMLFSIGILMLISIIFFVAFFYAKSEPFKWTSFIIGVIFFVIVINLLFVNMTNEVTDPKILSLFDFIAAASFYFYFFAGGMLIIIWVLTLFNTINERFSNQNYDKFNGGFLPK